MLPSKVTMAIPELESTTQLLVVLCSFGISATQIFFDSTFLSQSVWAGNSLVPATEASRKSKQCQQDTAELDATQGWQSRKTLRQSLSTAPPHPPSW